MKKRNTWLHVIFLVFVVVQLISSWLGNNTLEYIAKPFLLIWIAVFYILNVRKKDIRISLIVAFVFSWVGDMFLMVAHANEMFFYAGVGGFFFAQCFFIYTFLSNEKGVGRGYLRRKPWLSLIFVGLLVIMLWYLYDGMEGIMLPIITVYGVSLLLMSAAAFNRYSRTNMQSFILVFYGSIAFLLSDFLIAAAKFQVDIPRSSFLVISTYILAQYMIMRGMLLAKNQD